MITLIVPTRNRAHTLRRVAPKLFCAGFRGRIDICVSDADDDATPAVLAELARRFPQKSLRILRNENRRGASQSRNVGVAASTNEIILFCDDDEYLEAGYARKLLEKLQTENLGAISGRRVYMLPGETESQALHRFGIGWRDVKPFHPLICEGVNGARFSGVTWRFRSPMQSFSRKRACCLNSRSTLITQEATGIARRRTFR